MNFFDNISINLINFVLVTLFSLIIGLAQRRIHPANEEFKVFGTDRTFTFIGILGFILYIIQPQSMNLFIGGGFVLTVMFGIYYFYKLRVLKSFGITTIVIALITYSLGPLIITQPKWLFLLVIVTILIFTELKESFIVISQKFDKDEFLTLGKFIAIAGVILPIIPDEPIVSYIGLTPYKVWLAVVVISSISYISYLLQKFVFKKSGIIVSGILGGLYSSTVTTIILSRKSKEKDDLNYHYAASIILATAMMYFRIYVLLLIFNTSLAKLMFPYFAVLTVISIAVGVFILNRRKEKNIQIEMDMSTDRNPLEFKVALLFTVLYVVFTYATYYSIENFGVTGLNVLSFITGIADIDSFLINLFQEKYNIINNAIALATLQAIISNNIVKAIYASVFSNKTITKLVIMGFSFIIAINIILVIVLSLS